MVQTDSLVDKLIYLGEDWISLLKKELESPYMSELASFVARERSGATPIYPAKQNVFRAFAETPLELLRVVILGQDPYHGPGQANGLCFSVPKGISFPPSLQNIYKELVEDEHVPYPTHGDLSSWAAQGVLLLNTTLTVREKQPQSHLGRGWERFTDGVIAALAQRKQPTVFILWGRNAREKTKTVLKGIGEQHTIIESAHPSPLSAYRGFFHSRPFSQTNAALKKHQQKPIDWNVPA